jgi:hypothetical protein
LERQADIEFAGEMDQRMQWTSDAGEKFDAMLNDVPVMFRGMAKSMASAAAEKVAGERGATEVGYEDMVRGFIKATPGHMRNGLKQIFAAHGVDLEKYQGDFQQ